MRFTKRMVLTMRLCLILFHFLPLTWAFVPLKGTPTTTSQLSGAVTPPVFGLPIIGRFRRKKEVKQPVTVTVGDKLPLEMDVIQVGMNGDAVSLGDILGQGKTLLVGMPGAFTPTCTSKHLPGYLANAGKFENLGYSKIACLTTNDRFVNEEWGVQTGLKLDDAESPITILCDGDGDFVKSIGLADDMGFGVGVRSKRFAMALEDGLITHLLTDEGMDDCSCTSADNMLKVLTPVKEESSEALEVDFKVIGAGVVSIALIALLSSGMGGSPPATAPASPPAARVNTKESKPSQGTTFNLLNDYM